MSRRSDLRHPRTRQRPGLESLEGRQLMSLGSEFQVNTTTRNAQFDSDNASSANGSSVVVWTDTFSSSDHDIRAQRFDPLGRKLGPEIVVAGSSLDDVTPAVSMNSRGDFVVTWTQTQAGGDTNVLAQRFNASGARVGGIVPVGVGTFKEHNPDVALDDSGRFVVAYTRDTNNNNPDVFAKRYDANNQQLNVLNVGTTTKAEDRASVAITPDGRFDVAYQLQFSTTDDDIHLSRFSSGAALLGTTTVAGSTTREQAPSVSIDNFGNAVVAYQKLVGGDFDIKARRVSSFGSLGSEINIQSTTADETAPSVALKRGGGGFVVAYNSAGRVKVSEVSAVDAVLATFDAGSLRSEPALSIDGFGRYLLTDTATEFSPFPISVDRNIRGRFGRLS